jgi:hypothetical protein
VAGVDQEGVRVPRAGGAWPVRLVVRGASAGSSLLVDGAGWVASATAKTLAGTSGAGLGASAPAGPLTLAAGQNMPYFVLS